MASPNKTKYKIVRIFFMIYIAHEILSFTEVYALRFAWQFCMYSKPNIRAICSVYLYMECIRLLIRDYSNCSLYCFCVINNNRDAIFWIYTKCIAVLQ